MGEDREEDGGGIGADWGVGMIVWVRRRNGSWWPGRVLGPDEVPVSHLLSPRSGMPVQLLGREDGSVDWYNLEKSIRVKAFRCGEFDDCIQKAEASHGAPIKKREKYARREDAIRHALELEKKQLETIQDKSGLPTCGSTSRSVNARRRESELLFSDIPDKNDVTTMQTKFLEYNSHAFSKNTSLPLEEKNFIVNNRKSGKQIRPECNSPEAAIHTGDRRDSGHISATNKKSWHFVQGSGSRGKGVLINKREKSHGGSDLGHSYSSHSEGNPFVASTTGRTRSTGIPFQAEESKLFSFQYTNGSPGNDEYASEETSSDLEMDSLNCIKPLPEDYTFSDSSENNEPEITRREYMKIKMGENTIPLGEQCSMDNNGVSLSSLVPELEKHGHEHPTDASADCRVKWHMKGKRKVRNISKNSFVGMNSKTFICGSGKFNESSRMSLHGFHHDQKQVHFSSQDLHLIDENRRQEQVGSYSSWAHPSVLKSAANFHRISPPAWEIDESSHWTQGAYMEESDECYGPVYHGCQSKEVPSTLVDVDLQVKASYQGEHVPLVSLMSRLNGKAIIGHPVQVEILGDGSSNQYFWSTDADSDEATATQPDQRIDRQTAIHSVPRSSIVNSAFKDIQDRKRISDRITGHDIQKARLLKNSFQAAQLSPRKFLKNSLKREGLSSKNARRARSSLATVRRCSGRKKHAKALRDDDFLCGLIKPEGSLPLVTCVPVKVAFSRIMEAVGRPSTLSRRVRMTSIASKALS